MQILPKRTTQLTDVPSHDLSIPDIIRITGLGKNAAYRLRYWGEYRIGSGKGSRKIRREEFIYRRNNNLNIAVEANE